MSTCATCNDSVIRDNCVEPPGVLAMVSHELRRRAAALRVAAEAVDLTSAADPDLVVLLGWAAREMAQLDAFAAALQDGSRAHELVDLVTVCEQAAASVQLSNGAAITLTMPSSRPWVLTNPTLLRQALENLMENACRHGGGSAEVAVVLPAPSRPATALVVIRNRWDGASRPGRGVGLHIVERLLSSSSAELTWESRVGHVVASLGLQIAASPRIEGTHCALSSGSLG